MDGLNGCIYENWMDFSLCCRLLAQDPGRRDLFGARAIRTGMEYSAQRFGERGASGVWENAQRKNARVERKQGMDTGGGFCTGPDWESETEGCLSLPFFAKSDYFLLP